MAARTKRIDEASTVAKTRQKTKARTVAEAKTETRTLTRQPAPTAKSRRAEPAPKRAEFTPETEFMQAMQDYKKSSGRMFPTWSEVLEVLQALGYRKLEDDVLRSRLVPESA